MFLAQRGSVTMVIKELFKSGLVKSERREVLLLTVTCPPVTCRVTELCVVVSEEKISLNKGQNIVNFGQKVSLKMNVY